MEQNSTRHQAAYTPYFETLLFLYLLFLFLQKGAPVRSLLYTGKTKRKVYFTLESQRKVYLNNALV